MENEERTTFDLLQPELLPREALIQLLNERCPTLGEINKCDHGALVEMFYKNVAPHPQRKYRANRRGQRMMKNQIMREKRKRTHDQISGSAQQNVSQGSLPSSGLITSFNLKISSDRLKPPPSAINFDRKIVKLGKTSPTLTNAKVTQDCGSSTKIRLPSGNAERTNVISLNKAVHKSLVQGKSNVTVDSKHQNDTSSLDDAQNKTSSATPKSGITKIMPENKSMQCSKIKLKRTSEVTIESVMDTGSPLPRHADLNKTENKKGVVKNGTVNSESTSLTPNRKLSISNRKGGMDTETSPEEKQLKDHSAKDSPTEVVQKKFKRVAITWP